MAKSRSCKLCRAELRPSVAAHTCPHGEPCRYSVDDDGRVIDWETPQCSSCRPAVAGSATRFGLTAAALKLLDELGQALGVVLVNYRKIEAKSLTRLNGIADPWFLARYGMNLYRGCEHGCSYCDGRAERYYVQGDFARDIVVKGNAAAVLDAELARAREPGFVFIGGGVCDGYQPAEERFGLARSALELARKYGLAVHVLTKSTLVERDLELLAAINEESRAILSFSIQTLDETVRERFEPAAAPIGERLELLTRAKALGINTGVMAMPVLPGISDQPPAIDALVAAVAEIGVDFVSFGGLTLRPGVQRDTYLKTVAEHYPPLLDGYARAYRSGHRSGAPDPRYLRRVDNRFHEALRHHALPARPPRRLFQGMMPLYAELAVLLEHHDVTARIAGQTAAPLGRSGFVIQQWARQSFAKRGRRKAFSYHQLQEEMASMIADGSVAELPGFDVRALDLLQRLASETKPSSWTAWRHRKPEQPKLLDTYQEIDAAKWDECKDRDEVACVEVCPVAEEALVAA